MHTNYTVISEHELSSLIRQVNELLNDGYEPLGGIQIAAPVLNGDNVAPVYLQSLVKKVQQ